ncbi:MULTISPECIES: glutathione transferase [Rahnella]|uniref:Glutathione transferase n=1 Tax=Rahnella laticis TaxID=2787622 RepID=A0ABS0E6X0_9GAMM|nr:MULTISPECIES: glutathione transferase [Rahnella]MBF7980845.1 glutathione transferase [Rahnella laticis]MBF8000936.1 glutathione transferase [Rahnella sp. LAC-M12]
MSQPSLILYSDADYFSPYVMSAFVALTEKGIPFELETVDLAQADNLKESYSAISLTRRVPTLINGTFVLSESSAIDEYVEELFPAPMFPAIYPADPENRAKAREVQAWLRSDLVPIREERTTEIVFAGEKRPALSARAEQAAEKLYAAAERLLGDKEHLFGEWSIADVDLALMLNRLYLNGDAMPEKLAAYAKAQWQRASVSEWLALSAK